MAERLPNRQSSMASRRLSEHRISLRHSNPDIFSDDFALEPINVAYDVHHLVHGENPATTIEASTPDGLTSTQFRHVPRNLSRRKPVPSPHVPARRNSFTLRHDAQSTPSLGQSARPTSMSATSDSLSSPLRPMSIISDFSVPRMQSPFQGATGPSHPYGMYPQDIGLNRSSTVSTTRPPERPYGPSAGPGHPYGMYPQNTALEPEAAAVNMSPPVPPVGFSGHNQQYIRSLGPDGEDADDIVGPDGHTEQLPPYTRYPDSRPPNDGSSPDIGQNLELSMDTTVVPQASRSTNVSLSSDNSGPPINLAAATAAGQENNNRGMMEKLAAQGKRKTCCGKLPRWALWLIIFLSVALAGVLGGNVGHWASTKDKNGVVNNIGYEPNPLAIVPASTVFATVTATLLDATPLISVPANLPPLPTGNFGVPLGLPSASAAGCLPSDQLQAWSCAGNMYLSLNVTGSNMKLLPQVSLGNTAPLNKTLQYGPQPPHLMSHANVSLMSDKYNTDWGPAYYFVQYYDKIVVLHDSDLATPHAKRSLDFGSALEVRDSDIQARQVVHDKNQPEQPWLCFWNNTILEGFIYVDDNYNANSTNMSAILSNIPGYILPPSATPTTVSVATLGNAVETHSATRVLPTPYPKVVKFKESRSVGNPAPYCQKMQVLENNELGTVTYPDINRQIIVGLTETAPDTKNKLSRRAGDTSCYCEWTDSSASP